ncbi:hypothetical protein ACFQVA_16120 [Actinomadura keratinilytica]
MLSIAATARRGLVPDQLWDHTQPLSGGLDVLVGIGSAEQAAGFTGLWPTLGQSFAQLGDSPHAPADVIADCGRISGDTAAVELFPYAQLVLLVSRTTPEALARVRDRASHLTQRLHGGPRGAAGIATPLIGVVLVTDPGGSAKLVHQVNDMLVAGQTGARVVGTLAEDPAGADQLAGRRRGRLDKSLLIRSARKISADLYQQFGAAWSTPPRGPGDERRPPARQAVPAGGRRPHRRAAPPRPGVRRRRDVRRGRAAVRARRHRADPGGVRPRGDQRRAHPAGRRDRGAVRGGRARGALRRRPSSSRCWTTPRSRTSTSTAPTRSSSGTPTAVRPRSTRSPTPTRNWSS